MSDEVVGLGRGRRSAGGPGAKRIGAAAEVLRGIGWQELADVGLRARLAERVLRAADDADPVLVMVRRSDLESAIPAVQVGDDVRVLFDGYATTEGEMRILVGELVGDLVSVLARLRMIDRSKGVE